MRITLALMVYNEIEGLRSVFPKLALDAFEEIFVVDGGSTDGSVEYLKEHSIRIETQNVSGRSEAFRVAFAKSSGDAIIFFSPDGNEDISDLDKFRPLLEQGYDMVIANRMSEGGHNEEDVQLFKWRKWANQMFTLMANLTWNRHQYVADTINGYRAITRKAWNILAPQGYGYTVEYECSIRSFKKGLSIAEFSTNEGPRVDQRVGSPSISTGLAFLKIYFRELIRG